MAGWLGNLATTVSGSKIANIAGASLEEARPADPKLPTNEQGHSANIPARQRSEHEERAYQIKVLYVNDVQLIYAATCATGKNESWSLLSKSVTKWFVSDNMMDPTALLPNWIPPRLVF